MTLAAAPQSGDTVPLRLAMVQMNAVVGDLAGNAEQIRGYVADAVAGGAHLIAFPEMALVGYPVEDMALRRSFVDASQAAVEALAADLASDGFGATPVVVGYLDEATPGDGAGAHQPPDTVLPQNCAAVLHEGRVVARYAKHHLPNYGVFDERRIFAPGDELIVVRIGCVDVAIAICEDLWQEGGPVALTRQAGAELLLVINGSPYEQDKDDTRLDLARLRAGQAGATLAYLNLVGGQDDLVFDGGSLVVGADGEVLAQCPSFETGVYQVDLALRPDTCDPSAPIDGVRHVVLSEDPPAAVPPVAPPMAEPLEPLHEVWSALTMGLGDYVRKNGFASVCLGLSGGIDSTLVATLAADALGGERVIGISNPSQYSSAGSRDDAADLAARLGADYRIVPIEPVVDAYRTAMADAGMPMQGVADENIQSRVRGAIWMAVSNSEGALVLVNSNKSEVSVGYATMYGDTVGGFAPIKDVFKTTVWELARWRNAHARALGQPEPIPEATITKAPSAELRPGQTDQDSLPPYDVLDAILLRYVQQRRGRAALLEEGFDAETVDRVVTLVDAAEWKRRQLAIGTKITPLAFGRDRRLPVTNRWRLQSGPTA